MTKLELMKIEKETLKIADTIVFPTPYENDLWNLVSKPIVVYGISKYGTRKIDRAIERIAKYYGVDEMKVCDDNERQTQWFRDTYKI